MFSVNTTWKIFKTLEKDYISINYLGDFKDRNTDFIINLSESNIENIHEIKKFKKKVSFLIAESFQNIIRHGDDILDTREEALKLSPFFCLRVGTGIDICSANIIENSYREKLKEMIEQLNSSNPDELKEMYLHVLNNTGLSEKGGAGLGLIEMARKSGQKLNYFFQEIDPKHLMFYLQIRVRMEEREAEIVEDLVSFRNGLLAQKVIFAYKGEFSKDTVSSLLSIIENNLASIGSVDVKQKKSFIVLVELLQNVSKHGFKNHEFSEGIFTVTVKDKQLIFSTGNWISKEETPVLEAFITLLNAKSMDELKALYREKITSGEESKHEGAGVGLINMLRFTQNKINFAVHESHDRLLDFVTITISI